ncbi:MAG: YicC/YloC family endoribonuclease [Gemmatimonadaceae bacterium]
MTGFGAAEGTVGASRVSVELRSVNHRFFNATIRLAPELSRWEGEVREALRKRVNRGSVTLSARVERGQSSSVDIDEGRFAAYVELLRRLQGRYSLDGEIDIAAVLRLPDVLSLSGEEVTGDVAELVAIVDAAATALTAARTDEGARLVDYLHERLSLIESALQRTAIRAPQRLVEHRDHLRTAVRELTDGLMIDEQRVAMEIAVLADRLDVQEELSRFASHIAAFRETLARTDDEPVGKRLGFLLQEMLREANTTGSKANDADMLADVVTMKEELERIREQVENLE